MSAPLPPSVTIRLPRVAYLAVLFLVLASIAVAFGDSNSRVLDNNEPPGRGPNFGVSGFEASWRLLIFLVPLLAAVFIARTATVVSHDGLRVRAAFGSRSLPWSGLRGLSVTGRATYAVLPDGAVRLPCVRVAHLATLARYSEGRLPEIAEAVPKPAPSKRRR